MTLANNQSQPLSSQPSSQSATQLPPYTVNSQNSTSTVQTTTTQSSAGTVSSGGYTRRAKLGDSRSTGRLHTAASGNTHRSMTRLNIAGKAT